MQLGMIGLGRMGANMSRRLMRAGHDCVVYDVQPESVMRLVADGAAGATSYADLVAKLKRPRIVWMMVPASTVDATVSAVATLMTPGDVLVDGGNSHYHHDIRRAKHLGALGLRYLDVGTSGGIWGLDRGFCLMIGGDDATVRYLEPIFASLAPGSGATTGKTGNQDVGGTATLGYLHCGGNGAGHFVKMVHNGIEYGMMAAYAEGFNLLRHASIGRRERRADAETAPLANPEAYQYDLNLADIAEVWRHGSVVRSWLLDLAAETLHRDPQLAQFQGRVSDSGEGRWTVTAAIDAGVPTPVLAAALYERFSSRGEDEFANKLLSALRSEFGGHAEEKPGEGTL